MSACPACVVFVAAVGVFFAFRMQSCRAVCRHAAIYAPCGCVIAVPVLSHPVFAFVSSSGLGAVAWFAVRAGDASGRNSCCGFRRYCSRCLGRNRRGRQLQGLQKTVFLFAVAVYVFACAGLVFLVLFAADRSVRAYIACGFGRPYWLQEAVL